MRGEQKHRSNTPGGHTGVMPPRRILSTRWVTVIMVVALVCSIAVVWSLIQVTGGTPASSSAPPVSESAAGGASAGTASTDPTSASAGTGSSPSRPTVRTTDGSPAAPGSPDSGTPQPSSSLLMPSTATVLPGSALPLPAAWTGTAELTITVLGRCAKAGGTSSYTREADLALQIPAAGSGPIGDANPLSLTLGITPAGVPGLSVYSAATGPDGAVRRTWWLATGTSAAPKGAGRTELFGVLIDDQPIDGVLPPNLLVDNETDLQPCDNSSTVRAPRILAAGSTLTGWVDVTAGHLDLKATTTDGERSVSAAITLSRRAGT